METNKKLVLADGSSNQRVEAVEGSSGVIAHDFNNIMTIILGNTENALKRAEKTDQRDNALISNLKEIRESAERASKLTKRLLNLEKNCFIKHDEINEETDISLDKITVLFAEDDNQILNLSTEYLEILGCRVLSAHNGYDAMKFASEHRDEIKLLVTDVMMPEINGVELYQSLLEYIPGLNVIFTSGYTDDILENYQLLDSQYIFLQKPYTPQQLTECIIASLNKLNIRNQNEEFWSLSDHHSSIISDKVKIKLELLIEHKDILIIPLNNAMSSLCRRTVFPFCEKLREIDGLEELSEGLMASMEQFHLSDVEYCLEAILKVLEQ